MTIAENGYRYLSVESEYAGIHQRWLVVHSELAYGREKKTFDKNFKKARERNAIDLKHIRNMIFACEADALKVANRFSKKFRYQKLEYQIIEKTETAHGSYHDQDLIAFNLFTRRKADLPSFIRYSGIYHGLQALNEEAVYFQLFPCNIHLYL